MQVRSKKRLKPMTPAQKMPQPRPVRGRNPETGRKMGGAKSQPSYAATHLRPDCWPTKNNNPAYRKSILPAAKIAKRAAAAKGV